MTTAVTAESAAPTPPRLAIHGAGLTGLVAAYEALKRGETDIHIYEKTDRCGGVIKNGLIDNTIVNEGGECVDSDHLKLRALCKEKDLDVPVVENPSMENESFQRPDGSVMKPERFYTAYKPYAEQVIRDREELQRNPNGPYAQSLRSMSLDQYKQALAATVQPAPRSLWRALVDTLAFHGNDNALALDMATNTYTSESGQPLANISATSFISETSKDTKSLLASDCKFRIEGGTERLIMALRNTLKARGVHFHHNAELTKITPLADGKVSLIFSNPDLNTVADRTVLALPTYALGQIQGLETLGLSKDSTDILRNLQYTKNIKFTVAFHPGMEPPRGVFYANGFQCWSSEPGMLTFLAKADQLGVSQTPKQLLTGMMESYAKSHGSSAEKMFDTTKYNFTNPGNKACYASPAPGQTAQLDALKAQLPELAKRGIGIAGTFLPHHSGYGFMECGLASAQQSIDMLLSQEKTTDLALQKQWAPAIIAQRAAANDPQFAAVANQR